MVSLTRITGSVAGVSRGDKSRPAFNGIPIAPAYPSDTTRTNAFGNSPSAYTTPFAQPPNADCAPAAAHPSARPIERRAPPVASRNTSSK